MNKQKRIYKQIVNLPNETSPVIKQNLQHQFIEISKELRKYENLFDKSLHMASLASIKHRTEPKKKTGKSVDSLNLKNNIITWMRKNSIAAKEYNSELTNILIKLQNVEDGFDASHLLKEFNSIKAKANEAGKLGLSFMDKWKQRASGLITYLSTFASFYDIIATAQRGFQSVTNVDTAVTELHKVSSASSSEIDNYFSDAAESAKDLGSTITNTINATADWSRQGYNLPDSNTLAEVALLYKNVGDGIDINAANQTLISTLQGFQLQADSAMSIIDKFNEVANRTPIDSGGIGEALKRSAASFYSANTDLSKSIALIVGADSVVQNPESVGTMWKTVSMRIRGAKVELEDAGLETEGMVETTSELRDLVKGMTGFDIMKDENTFKDIYEIIIGIGEEWEKLSDIEQASLLEKLAGKRNGNALAAAFANIDLIKEAYTIAENSEGSALREQENYEKSIQYSLDRLKASAEEFWYTFIDTDTVKNGIDLANTFLNVITKIIDQFGALPTILTLATPLLSKFGLNFVSLSENGKLSSPLINQLKQIKSLQDSITYTDGTFTFFELLNKENTSAWDNNDIQKFYYQHKDSLGEVNDELKNIIETAQSADELFTQFQNRIQQNNTALSKMKVILKDVALNIGMMLVTTLAVKAVSYVFDELYTSFEQQEEIVNDLTTKVSDLKTEYQQLNSSSSLSNSDKQRLGYLERQITYNETLLKQEQQKLAMKELYGEGSLLDTGSLKATGANDQLDANIQRRIKDLKDVQQQYQEFDASVDGKGLDYLEGQHLTKKEFDLTKKLEADQQEVEALRNAAEENVSILQSKLDSGVLDISPVAKEKVEQDLEYNKNRVDDLTEYINSINAVLHVEVNTEDPKRYLKSELGNVSWMEKLSGEEKWSDSQLDYLDTLSDEEIKYLIDIEDDAGSLTFEEAQEYIKELRKEANKDIEIDLSTQGILTSLEQMSDGFDKFKAIYNDVQDSGEFNYDSLINEDFANMMQGYTKEYQNFVDVVSNSPTDIVACQNAFDDLVTAWFYGQEPLKNITDETYDLTVAWLKQHGVANASEMADYALAESKKEAFIATHTLKEGTNEEILALLEEANAAGFTENSMYSLALAIATADDTSLSFEQQISAIYDIANAAGLATNALNALVTSGPSLNSVDLTGFDNAAKKGDIDSFIKEQQGKEHVNRTKKAFEDYISTYKTDYKPTASYVPKSPSGSSGGGRGGSGSGGSEREKYQAEIDKYKELSDAVEEVKSEIEELDQVYSHTDNIDEQIALKDKIIGLYKKEQDALDKLNKARDKEIDENVKKLRSVGFKIDYNPNTEKLVIHNREKLNSLSQDSIKDYEELIKKTEELNDANKDSAKQWRDLSYTIQDAAKEISELRQKKYDEYIKDAEHIIDLLSNRKDTAGFDMHFIDAMMQTTLDNWKRLLAEGYDVNKDIIQDLEKAWMDYYDQRLESEKELLEKQKESKDNALSAVIDLIEDQIKGIDDEIESMQKLNEERKEALDLQKAQAALDKAKEQKTTKVLRKGKGWVYEADEDAIKQAEEDLADKQFEHKINALEKEKEKLEEYKNMWEELPDLFEKQQNKLQAEQLLGKNWEEDILSQRIDVYNKFKDDYIGVQQQIYDKTYELENHMSELYTNMTNKFLAMYAMLSGNQGSASTGKGWYVDKNGQAPVDAQVNDIIYTNGGTYQITGKDAHGKFISKKIDDVNSHIQDGMWGKEVPSSNSGLQEALGATAISNQQIVDTNEKQIEQVKKNILENAALQNFIKFNSDVTEKDVEAILNNIDSTDDLIDYTDDNSGELNKNTRSLQKLIVALMNFSLAQPEEKILPEDPFADIDVNSLTQDEKNYMNQLKDAYNAGLSNGNIPDKLLGFIADFNAGNAQEYIEIGKEAYKAGTTPYEHKSTVNTSSNKDASNKLLSSYKQQREWADKYGGSKEYKDRLDSAIAREEYGSGHTITTSSNGYTNYHEIRPTNPKEEKMSADQIKAQNANKKSTDKNTDKLDSASDKVTDAADHIVSGVSDAVSNISVDVNVKGGGSSGGSRGGGGGNGDKTVTYNHGKVTITQTTHKDGSTTTNVSNSSTGQSIGTVHNKPNKKSVPSPSAFSLNSSDRMLDYDSFDDPYALPEDIDVLSASIKDAAIATTRFNDSVMTVADQKWVKQLQQTWNDANKAGNKELMKKVSETADAIRNQYISGMKLSDGTDYSPIGIDGLSKVYDEFSRSLAYGGANAAGIKGTTKSIYGLDATDGADVLKAIDRGLLTKDEAMNLVQLSGGKYTDDGRKKHISTDGTDYTDWDAKQIGDKHETASGEGYWTKTVYTDPETGRQITLTDYTNYAEEAAQKKF